MKMPAAPPQLSFFPQKRDAAVLAKVHVRWDIKTGSDAAAKNIDAAPKSTSIAELTSTNAPDTWPPPARVKDVETTIWELESKLTTLVGYKYESDQDYHLVLSDDNNVTIIVEIPDPSLLDDNNPYKANIAAARKAFDAKFGLQIQALKQLVEAEPPSVAAPMLVQIAVPVHVTGIGFFDYIHNQSGVAPNGVELHPVLSIAF